MKRIVLFGLLALSLAGSARASEQPVTFAAGADKGMGLLVTPSGKGPWPAVVVIQEWWGLDNWVKDQARALAKQGYVALAVDLYRGKVTKDQAEAHQLMMGLSPDRGMADLKGGLAFLRARKDVKASRIGVIGWCMGGRYALALATEDPDLAAVVPYYGAPPTDPAKIAAIKAPILGNYGGDDKGPAPEDVRAFETTMKGAGKSIDVKIYPGAPHAFANPNNPWKGYREDAAKDAWARTLEFFKQRLQS